MIGPSGTVRCSLTRKPRASNCWAMNWRCESRTSPNNNSVPVVTSAIRIDDREASVQTCEQRRINVDTVPQVLKAQIFIRCVLVIVVICDRQSNYGCIVRLLKQIHRNTAADGWQQ